MRADELLPIGEGKGPYREDVNRKDACFRASTFRYDGNLVIPPHFHRELELVTFRGVTGTLRAANREESIADDRCYLIAPDSVHSYRLAPRTVHSATVLLLDAEDCASALSSFSPGFAVSLLAEFTGEGMSWTDGGELPHLLRELAVCPAGTLQSALRTTDLILRILVLAPRFPDGNVARDPWNEKARKVIGFVRSNFSGQLSLDRIAEACAVSKFHLARSFKAATGYTVGEYVARTRVREARRLLAAGCSVTESCFASGFRDLSHFIVTFRKMEGRTPKRWALDHRAGLQGGTHLPL